MKPSGFYDLSIANGASANLLVHGDYFKIMSASGPISVRSDFGELTSLVAGQGLENTPFKYLTLRNNSGGLNAVRIFVGDENFIDGLSGSVAISTNKVPTSGAYTNASATVTNTAAQLLAANAARGALTIQNNHASANLFIGFSGAVTTANGLKVVPGGFIEFAVVPTGAIHAIGDVASNTAVVIVEG